MAHSHFAFFVFRFSFFVAVSSGICSRRLGQAHGLLAGLLGGQQGAHGGEGFLVLAGREGGLVRVALDASLVESLGQLGDLLLERRDLFLEVGQALALAVDDRLGLLAGGGLLGEAGVQRLDLVGLGGNLAGELLGLALVLGDDRAVVHDLLLQLLDPVG